MRRRAGFITVIGSIAVVGGVLAACLATGSSASTGDTQIQVFKPDGPYEKFVDVGKAGFSPGDQILQWQALLDPADGSMVGRVVARVEIVKHRGKDDLFILDGTAKLEGGSIVFYGAARVSQFETGIAFPVTGGSGIYEHASGKVTAVTDKVSGTSGVLLSFDLATV